jgi:predicted Zn-dependent protease
MVEQLGGLPSQNAFSLYLRAALLLQRGEVERAAPVVRQLNALDTAQIPRQVRGVPRALAGWLAMAQGDTAGGLEQIESGVREAGGAHATKITTPLRVQWAIALASNPTTRAEGIRRLRHGFDNDPEFLPISFFYLGRVYEAAGERTEAAQAYGQFIRLWDKPDPEVAGRVEEAKRALAALTAEP